MLREAEDAPTTGWSRHPSFASLLHDSTFSGGTDNSAQRPSQVPPTAALSPTNACSTLEYLPLNLVPDLWNVPPPPRAAFLDSVRVGLPCAQLDYLCCPPTVVPELLVQQEETLSQLQQWSLYTAGGAARFPTSAAPTMRPASTPAALSALVSADLGIPSTFKVENVAEEGHGGSLSLHVVGAGGASESGASSTSTSSSRRSSIADAHTIPTGVTVNTTSYLALLQKY